MPAQFNWTLCSGCGLCERQCPGDIIRMQDTPNGARPWNLYPQECWHCASCRQDCPAGAVTIIFPPDMLTI